MRTQIIDKLGIYTPPVFGRKPVEWLITLGKKRDRSGNYLVRAPILAYLDRERNDL